MDFQIVFHLDKYHKNAKYNAWMMRDDAAKRVDERDRGGVFKNCARFINCKSEINNTEIDNVKVLI